MPSTLIYRTSLPDAVRFSLFADREHPRSRSEEEYLASEERFDAEGHAVSLVHHGEDGAPTYRRSASWRDGRLAREREEFLDVGTVVTREHAWEGSVETVRVLFGEDLDEVVVRELGAGGKPAAEQSTDASGEPRSMTEWDAAGRITHAESPGAAQELSWDADGNLVEMVVQRDDGSETIERSSFVDGRVSETEITEDGAPAGSRRYEYGPGTTRMTETRRGLVTASREERVDGSGRLLEARESSADPAGSSLASVYRHAWEPDGKRRSVEFSREAFAPGGRGASVASGFRQFTYDARGRVAEILVAGPSEESGLEPDSYYRFEYVD